MSSADPTAYRPLQDGLRAAGRYLDTNDRRLVSLLVVSDGIIVTVLPRDLRGAGEAVLLTHEDLRTLWGEARTVRGSGNLPHSPDPIFPTGYEDFLRALGDAAARQRWTSLRLLRLGDEAILRYGPLADRKEMVLEAHDVEAVLNRAFSHRGKGPLS